MERARQERWDRANLRTACTKMTVEDYEDFRILCVAEGTTPYAVIRAQIAAWVRERLGDGSDISR
ncbi:hypothetical protein H8790_01075 [Oscillibacter hominis]|uniref:Uncharacterized protein n=1 Tax=Oscillibacter hominis TaxID=2763056 RepID=A0A7G9B547_9FIRM|nr:hypothetical protein [Oscillibacter hominis]QNL44678.1 hypothetical protein H8790_01075 [Oscillibacter hominis]